MNATSFEECVGARLVGEELIPVTEFGHVFERSDRIQRRRTERTWHSEEALKRWALRLVKGRARRTHTGYVFTTPKIEYQRDASRRVTQIMVWAEYGLIPHHPETVIRMPEPLPKGWTGA